VVGKDVSELKANSLERDIWGGGRTQKQKQEKEIFFHFNGLDYECVSALTALLLIIFSIIFFSMTGLGHRGLWSWHSLRQILLIFVRC
jgi:hypothetical protein